MGFMNTINIVGSGLTAQQLRLDIVAENVTNSQTTRTENGGGAYRRKMVVFEAVSGRDTFRDAMARASARAVPNGSSAPTAGGVRVTQIDAMAASRAYASNVTAFNTLKSVLSSGLEIGR